MFDRFAIDDGRHSPDLVIEEDATHAAGFHLAGLGCGFGLMVATRRYIAPTRD